MSDHRAPQRASLIGRPPRRLLAVLTVLLVVAGTTWFTSASFTSGTDGSATVRASDDYYPPKVAVTSPGATVSGVVAISATASDTGSGVAQVVIQRATAGSSTWTTLCTDTTSPYSCSWDTATVADGDYQLRAIATDRVGSTTTSAAVPTRVANPAAVTIGPIADVVRGTVPLSASVTGVGSRTVSTAFQFQLVGATSWTTITGCATVAGTTPTCSWNTGTMADVYDVRAVSTVGTGGAATTVSSVRPTVVVDNQPPAITVDAPAPMSGTVQVTATTLDEDSGVQRVELQYRLSGATTWTTLCTVTTEPFRCALDTTRLTNLATYDLRGSATDVAGNATTSAVVSRQVNNGLASITITSPLTGDQVTGTRTITTDHATPLGQPAGSVRIEARLVGGAFATVCTDTSAPFTCDWATATLASGQWELRATMTYNLTLTAVSPIVTVSIDNNPLKALDIQAANSGTSGQPTPGDVLTFTYQGNVDLTTLKSGWTGASTSLTMTLVDKNVSPATVGDRATFSVPLGTVTFVQNYIRAGRSATLPATMTGTSGTSGGQPTTVITVVLGSFTNGDLRTGTSTGAMRWSPLATVRNTAGFACSTTTAVESGAGDKDL